MKTMFIIILAVTFSTNAQWSTDSTVNTPICRAPLHQDKPLLISDGAGGSIITWNDTRNLTTLCDIYAQLINAVGVVQWTTDGVAICTASNDQILSGIISDGAGGAIITWCDYRNGTANPDIYIQRINAAGVVQWTADGVAICTSSNNQDFPVITSDGANGAFITWRDYRNGTANSDIYSQRISATGIVQWTANGVAICTDSQNQNSPFILSDGANGAIIAWDDYRNGTTTDIYSQRISAAGDVQWTANGVAICTASNHQFGPVVTSDGANGAIIVWTDSRSGTTPDIYSQRISAAGDVQWTADGVAVSTALRDQFSPAITSDGANGAIIAWDDYRNGTTRDIYSQRISAAGDVQWTSNGVAICTAFYEQLLSGIISDGASGAIIVWDDRRNLHVTNGDIYSQRINAAGVVQWTANGVAICTNSYDQFWSAITSNGANGAIIVWNDWRNDANIGNMDIYAQRVNSDGTLGGTTGVEGLETDLPVDFSLKQNYPNPFNPSTCIKYAIGSEQLVSLKIYNVLGNDIATLVNEEKPAGTYEINFNASQLSSGVYFYKLQAGSFLETKKLTLIK
jgi:predicted lipoprotein with Yx(FWY)xxD motif